MEMPILKPVPIKTRNHPLAVRIWRWITCVRKWEVAGDWTHTIPDGTTIVIHSGFTFDGASIPKPLWALLSPTGLLLIPGLIHDYAYRYDYLIGRDAHGMEYKYKQKAGRKHWDRLFREVGLKVNGLTLIDTLAWAMLYLFGGLAWNANRKRAAAGLRHRFSG